MSIDARPNISPPLFTVADLRVVEQHWERIHPGESLMEKAGAAAAALAVTLAGMLDQAILILAGQGNNGGDAVVAARLLAAQGYRVEVVSRAADELLPQAATNAWHSWRAGGGTALPDIPLARQYSLVIDGLFGIGLQRDITGQEARWIEQANTFNCPRLALDVPSGLDSDSGKIRGHALRANHTLTFVGLKPGLLTADGPDVCGKLHLDRLGIDAWVVAPTLGIALTGLENRHRLPPRARNSHKGQYGHIGILGGSPGMVGAALIAGRAALEQGAGSVTLGVLDERIAVDYAEPRLMFRIVENLLDMQTTILAAGPGLGQSPRAHALLKRALTASCPLVLDADALNLLAVDSALVQQTIRRTAPTLITPHPGEAARLLKVDTATIQHNRIEAARKLSALTHAHVALKGAGTVIFHPDGHYAINTSGGPWLAQAGSGDRLTGMVAALLGQGMAAQDALEAAVWLHGNSRVTNGRSD